MKTSTITVKKTLIIALGVGAIAIAGNVNAASRAHCGSGAIDVVGNGNRAVFTDRNGRVETVYTGKYQISRVSPCDSGVLTAFRIGNRDEVYYSPNCRNIGYVGRGSNTQIAYKGKYKVSDFYPQYSGGVKTRFVGLRQTYLSPNCLNIGTIAVND